MFEDITNSVEVSRRGLVILYVIRSLNEMVDIGLVEGKAFELSERAHELLEGLDPLPTDEETEEVLEMMRAEGYIG